jgi:hypothetical protein
VQELCGLSSGFLEMDKNRNILCSCSRVVWTSLIAAYGIPLPSNTCNHCCVVFLFVIDSIIPSSTFRFFTRVLLVINLESSAHSGFPIFSQRTPKSRSFPPPSRISPSAVLKPRYGTIEAVWSAECCLKLERGTHDGLYPIFQNLSVRL